MMSAGGTKRVSFSETKPFEIPPLSLKKMREQGTFDGKVEGETDDDEGDAPGAVDKKIDQ